MPVFVGAVSIGSNTTPSRQPFAVFPTADSDNTMQGVASFEGGFALEDIQTTCTFDDFYSVCGVATLGSGLLWLKQDLTFGSGAKLSNTGKIFANNHAVRLDPDGPDVNIPSTGPYGVLGIRSLASYTMGKPVISVAWSYDGNYVTAATEATGSDREMRTFYFDGSTITYTASASWVAEDRTWYDLAWHPSAYYMAAARDGSASESLRLYRLKISNGTFVPSDTKTFGSAAVYSVAWHPSGNYLLVGKDYADSTAEIVLYSFSTVTGLLTSLTTANISPNRRPSNNAASWAPGGSHIIIGTDTSGSGPQLLVYSFNGTSLTLTASAQPGHTVNAADWSPTGTYVAVGLAGSTNTLRVYQHSPGANTLVECAAARQAQTRQVKSMHWSADGNYLLVGFNGTTQPQMAVYHFDKQTCELTMLLANVASGNPHVLDARFTTDMGYIARGDQDDNIIIYQVYNPVPLLLKDGVLDLNANVTLHVPLHCAGFCKIWGDGHRINLVNNGQIIVRPGGTLELENVCLQGVSGQKLACMTDNASITMRNAIVSLSADTTFSRGALLWEKGNILTGSGSFGFNVARTSTIAGDGLLFIDRNITFTYAPRVAKRNLLAFGNPDATLYLHGASLRSTRTGIALQTGSLILDDSVTFSSQARNAGEAIQLKNSLNMRVLAGARLDVFGHIRYE